MPGYGDFAETIVSDDFNPESLNKPRLAVFCVGGGGGRKPKEMIRKVFESRNENESTVFERRNAELSSYCIRLVS